MRFLAFFYLAFHLLVRKVILNGQMLHADVVIDNLGRDIRLLLVLDCWLELVERLIELDIAVSVVLLRKLYRRLGPRFRRRSSKLPIQLCLITRKELRDRLHRYLLHAPTSLPGGLDRDRLAALAQLQFHVFEDVGVPLAHRQCHCVHAFDYLENADPLVVLHLGARG